MDFFFLSQLVGRPVRASFGDRIARVKDLVARLEVPDLDGEISLEAYPPVSGLVIDIDKRAIFVPWSHVKSLGPEGALLSSPTINMQRFERRDGEVLLARDILDK